MKFLTLGLGVIALGLLSSGCKPRERVAAENGVSTIAATKLDPSLVATAPEAVPQKLPRLLDLGAKKCVPCKQMVPVLAALTSEYAGRLEVVFIDVWEQRAEGQRYGIRMIPTQIFYDAEGRELSRHEGYMSKEAILNRFKQIGVELDRPPVPRGEKSGT